MTRQVLVPLICRVAVCALVLFGAAVATFELTDVEGAHHDAPPAPHAEPQEPATHAWSPSSTPTCAPAPPAPSAYL